MNEEKETSLEEALRAYERRRPKAKKAATLTTLSRLVIILIGGVYGMFVVFGGFSDFTVSEFWLATGLTVGLFLVASLAAYTLPRTKVGRLGKAAEETWYEALLPEMLARVGLHAARVTASDLQANILDTYFPRVAIPGIRRHRPEHKISAQYKGVPIEIEETEYSRRKSGSVDGRGLMFCFPETAIREGPVVVYYGKHLQRRYSAKQLKKERTALPHQSSGDPRFDEVFSVLSASREIARDLLNPSLRESLLALAKKRDVRRIWLCWDAQATAFFIEDRSIPFLVVWPVFYETVDEKLLAAVEERFAKILAIPKDLGLLPKP